jgi:hypothetical protein
MFAAIAAAFSDRNLVSEDEDRDDLEDETQDQTETDQVADPREIARLIGNWLTNYSRKT